jgi:hypothetical protein
MGEKTLNTGFAVSYYDPVRKIFGRRSEVFALPYIFAGGPVPDAGHVPPQLLSNARTQYSKCVKTPKAPAGYTMVDAELESGKSEWKIAVWFTRGFVPAANTTTGVSGGWWAVTLWTPAMSKRMNEMLFLEGIFEQNLIGESDPGGGNRAVCKKDDNRLFASGRYLDLYARPVPARHFTILPNGVALYIYPRVVATREIEQTLDVTHDFSVLPIGKHAEYSVKHPEQVGRNTEEQRDTVATVGQLKGDIKAIVEDGASPLVFTRSHLYRLGFSGDTITFGQITGGYGVLNYKSIAEGSNGIAWVSDEGVVWKRGDKIILLDKELGFGEWFDKLPISERERVRVGMCDTLSQILIHHDVAPDTGDLGDRVLVYDYANQFVSEFRGSDAAPGTYMAFAKFVGILGSGQLVTEFGAYPHASPTSYASETTEVEMWVNDQVHRPKELGWIEVKLGKAAVGGTVTLTVEARDHPDTASEFVDEAVAGVNTRTANLSASATTGQKVRLADFIGMRGRLFRISLTAAAGIHWGLQEVKVEYEMDEQDDMRSV